MNARPTAIPGELSPASATTRLAAYAARALDVRWLPLEDGPVHLAVALSRAGHGASAGGGSGAGLDAGDAARRAIGEACEVASARWRRDDPLRLATRDALDGEAVEPEHLLLVDECQRAGRAAWNARYGEWEPLPPPRDAEQPVHWIEASDLDGRRAWLPAACVLLDFAPDGFAVADTNGCAAGETPEQAAVAAFLELVERDAVARWWLCGRPRPEIALRDGDLDLGALVHWLARRGRRLHLLDIGAGAPFGATGVRVVAAITCDDGGRDVALGFGSAFDSAAAVAAAARELVQSEWLVRQAVVARAGAAASRRAIEHWCAEVSLARQPWLVPAVAARGRRRRDPLSPDLDTVRELCARLGLRAFALDLTRADIGVPVMRLVVPGLRPMKVRLAPDPVPFAGLPDRHPQARVDALGIAPVPVLA